MRIKINDNEIADISMGPLIDCVFLLLIFFLVATTLKKPTKEQLTAQVKMEEEKKRTEELNIKLPEPAISAGEAKAFNPVILSITEKGEFYFQNYQINRNEIHQKLRQIAKYYPDKHIRIDVDRRAESQSLIYILDLCAYEGLNDYAIHTLRKNVDN